MTAIAGDNGSLNSGTPSPVIVDPDGRVSFTFDASTNYHIATIIGCGIDYSNSSNGVVSYSAETEPITVDCTVNASFALNRYTVTATVGDNGSLNLGTPSPVIVDSGGTVNFTFDASTNYHIATIIGCGVDYSNSNNGVVSNSAETEPVTADCAIKATFAINMYSVTSSVSGGNGSIDPEGSQDVTYGDTRQFSLSAGAGYHPEQVSGTCGGILSANTFTTNTVSFDCTVIASFANQYMLSVLFTGPGSGTVTSDPAGITNCAMGCNAAFLAGTDVTLTAVADGRSKFTGWSGDGCIGDDEQCTITLDQAREITATFDNGFLWNLFLPAIMGDRE